MRDIVSAAFVSLALLLPSAGMAAEKLHVPTPTYSKNFTGNQKMKQECNADDHLARYLKDAAGDFDIVTSDAGGAKKLTLTILSLEGVGGGPATGRKSMTVEGKLVHQGKTLGSFLAMRASGGGGFVGYKSTCSIIERCARTLGKDVAEWLQQPSMNAKLGELK